MSRRREQRYRPETAPRIELAIDAIDDAGRGVGRVDGKVVFVAGALPGERVRARYLGTGRRADEAIAEAVVEASHDRATPFCPVFDRCGGCTLQHWRSEAQRGHREARLHGRLERAAGQSPRQWLEPVVGPERGYRMRARWGCRAVSGRGVVLGFREEGGQHIVDADACPVLDERLSQLMDPLKRALAGLSQPGRVGEIEACASDADTAVGLELNSPLRSTDEAHLAKFAGEQGAAMTTRVRGQGDFVAVAGTQPPRLVYELPDEGVTLDFALGDFVQANPWVNRGLVARAMAWLEPDTGARVLDLFTGVGNLALPVARRGATVVGLEGDPRLVERARANAEANGLADRARFDVLDLAGDGVEAAVRARQPDAVVLDPPRAGATQVVAALAQYRPARVVYVSCEPATLARDVERLASAGYRLMAAGSAEMFPHTAHAEAIACLERAA